LENCKWTKSGKLSAGLRFGISVADYIIGGEDREGQASKLVHRFGDKKWMAELPENVTRHCATIVGSEKIFIIGGHVGNDQFSPQTFILNLISKETRATTSMNGGNQFLKAFIESVQSCSVP
jgi:N-acetylneuraminic acid mutarotase